MNFFRKQFDSIPRSFFFTYFCIQVRNKLIYCFFEILMKTFRKKWSRKLERRISLTATFLLFHEQPGFERRTFFRPGLPLTTDRLKSFFFFVDFCSVRLNFLWHVLGSGEWVRASVCECVPVRVCVSVGQCRRVRVRGLSNTCIPEQHDSPNAG